MNQIPKTSEPPDITAYWRFANDPKHVGKTVMQVDGGKIKVAPRVGILGKNEISYLSSADNLEYAVNTADVVEHFKEALCNKYGKTRLRDFFSEAQELQALDGGLTQELVKEVAHNVAQLGSSARIDAYWQFAVDPTNVGKLVVEAKENRLQFGDNSHFHPDSTEDEMKFVKHPAIVNHFKEALCERYGKEVLRNLLSKAQEEEARYGGLTQEIVKQVFKNAEIVDLFQQLKKYQDSIKKTLEEYKSLPSQGSEKRVEHLFFLAEKIKLSFSQHQSLVHQFQEMIAADPANIVLQMKAKSSCLTFQKALLLEMAQLSVKVAQEVVNRAIQAQEENLSDIALSPKRKNTFTLKIQEYTDQAVEVLGILALLQKQAPAVMNKFLETHKALLTYLERKIAEMPGDSLNRIKEFSLHAT